MLSKVTAEDFRDLFEKVFFSKTTKRVDLQLTSQRHGAEQEEYYEKNMEHPFYDAKITKRVKAAGSITDFKRTCATHPDFYKAKYL